MAIVPIPHEDTSPDDAGPIYQTSLITYSNRQWVLSHLRKAEERLARKRRRALRRHKGGGVCHPS